MTGAEPANIKPLTIDPSELIQALNTIKAQSDGDLARDIELLLLENHVLSLGQSAGFRRGIDMDFSTFPRFLKIEEGDQTDKEKG